MIRIYLVVLSIGILISVPPLIAGNVSVRVNEIDYGFLCKMSVSASSITIDTGSCSDEVPVPQKLIDPACSATPSLCEYFELPIDNNTNYDGHIKPGYRDVYHFRSPAKGDLTPPEDNLLIRFTVIDYGAEVSINLGISDVKGRVLPADSDNTACYTGPGTELSLIMATDETYTRCVMAFDKDYYFTIENRDASIIGGYRLEFKNAEY